MKGKSIKSRVLAILEEYLPEDFDGKITKDVLLTDVFGQNHWNTHGIMVVASDLEEKFAVEISEDVLPGCKTFGDLVKAVTLILARQKPWRKVGQRVWLKAR